MFDFIINDDDLMLNGNGKSNFFDYYPGNYINSEEEDDEIENDELNVDDD